MSVHEPTVTKARDITRTAPTPADPGRVELVVGDLGRVIDAAVQATAELRHGERVALILDGDEALAITGVAVLPVLALPRDVKQSPNLRPVLEDLDLERVDVHFPARITAMVRERDGQDRASMPAPPDQLGVRERVEVLVMCVEAVLRRAADATDSTSQMEAQADLHAIDGALTAAEHRLRESVRDTWAIAMRNAYPPDEETER